MSAPPRPAILVLPGDGIGPEITREMLRVIDWFAQHRDFDCNVTVASYGANAYRSTGTWLGEDVMADMLTADAVFLGAVGSGPDFEQIPVAIRRRFGAVSIRRHMGLFANLRPIRSFPAVASASSLRPDVLRGVDLLFVRELLGGLYTREPRGIEALADGERRGVNTQVYTSSEIRRVAQVAFEAARARRGEVTSIDKANVLETGTLWREEVQALRDKAFSDVGLRHMYVDTCAFELAHAPRQFDVLLADNMFGDILSDGAANIAGSPGMLPSVALGPMGPTGRRRALYEPLHADASHIVGQDRANPIGAILGFALALHHSFGRAADARLLDAAVDAALAGGAHPADVAPEGSIPTSTTGVGDAVLAALAAAEPHHPTSPTP